MKLAVISNIETAQGRSVFSVLLAHTYAYTQQKRAVMFCTGEATNLMKMVEVNQSNSIAKSVSVFKALLESESIDSDGVYDYGYQVGNDNVWLFDLVSRIMTEVDIQDLFLQTINKMERDLKIIEVVGDINTSFNESVINQCDAILNVFQYSHRSMDAVREYNEKAHPLWVRRTGYVCQRWDKTAISEKAVAAEIGVQPRLLLSIPYNTNIVKEAGLGTLNTLGKYISAGHPELTSLRMKMLEVMSYLYDVGGRKIIKGVNEWPK
jgi:hypothetical protein